MERIAYADGSNAESFCEISSVLSCNSIFSHWQSSALGVPNTLVSLPVFALLASAGLAGLLGSRLSRAYAAALFGVIIVGVGLTRVVDAERALGSGRVGQRLRQLVDAGADLVIWIGLGVLIAVLLYLGLAL